MTNTITKTADTLEAGDIIVLDERTTFEVDTVELGIGTNGDFLVLIDGYKMRRAGVCGPAGNVLKTFETVTVQK